VLLRGCFRARRLRVPGKKIAMDQEQQRKQTFSTPANQRGSRAPTRSPRRSPFSDVMPHVLRGSSDWGLQQIISKFVVAGVALCHFF
jgi:hypothetical protein